MLERLPPDLRARVAAYPGAASTLTALVDQACSSHPELAVSPEAFARYLVERIPEEGDLGRHLEAVHVDDLALAFACAAGDPRAIRRFEERCFGEILFAHARVRPPLSIDEVAQVMRDRLFVPSADGAPPRITQYSGQGDLRAWFRVGLVRHLLNEAMRSRQHVALDDALLEALPAAAVDVELDHLRERYAPLLRQALVDSVAALEARDRTLLRLAVCEGMTVDALGDLYGVHRATAARWVASARASLEAAVRERLRAELAAGDESLTSLCRLLASQVDFSLQRHLAGSSGDSGGGSAR